MRTRPRLTTPPKSGSAISSSEQDAEHRQHRHEQRRRRQVALAQGEDVGAPEREDELGELGGLEVGEAQVESTAARR